MRRNIRFASGLDLLPFCLLLAGCGIGSNSLPSPTLGRALSGLVHGGAQPISGAYVRLYAVGNAGNGSPATDILTGPNGTAPLAYATTLADGSFSISGDYNCPTNPATPVYLAATGGNPGLSGNVNNTSLALVAALGPCSDLSATQHIEINEATTAAAAWALAPFATSITDIGASSTNLAGITQAFAIANQLVDTSLGSSPNASVAAWTYIETPKLYSLADVLATCVNSSGVDGDCSTLFSYATPSNSTTPTDTFAAALNIVQNPSNNVGRLFGLIPTTPPFPALSTSPNDWTLTITYTEDPYSTGPLAGANVSTIDQQGNLWGTLEYQEAILKFSPQFDPLVNVTLYPFDNTNQNLSIEDTGSKTSVMSIDPGGNLWFASGFSTDTYTNQTINPTGAIFELDTNGNALSPSTGYSDGGIVNPQTAMADTNGFVWAGSLGLYLNAGGHDTTLGGDISLLSPAGIAQSPASGWNTSLSFQPGIIDFDAYHNAWVTNNQADQLLIFPPLTTGSGLSNPAPATILPIPGGATDIVFDNQDQGWVAANGNILEIHTDKSLGSALVGSGLVSADLIAVDASNRLWVLNVTAPSSNSNYDCAPVALSVFSGGQGGGSALSSIALGNDIGVCVDFGVGQGFLLDNAGSVLIDGVAATYGVSPAANILNGSTGLVRFVGLATPTKTPNTGPPQAP